MRPRPGQQTHNNSRQNSQRICIQRVAHRDDVLHSKFPDISKDIEKGVRRFGRPEFRQALGTELPRQNKSIVFDKFKDKKANRTWLRRIFLFSFSFFGDLSKIHLTRTNP